MIAAAGAGPKPILQKSLSVQSLVDAIRFCLTPEASEAAQQIAAKMSTESGVKSAVASFHAHLPSPELECDVIKGQPAAWVYKENGTRLKLSKVAAEILASHQRLDHGYIKPYVTCVISRLTQSDHVQR
jgi:hypothetical protein